MRAAAPLALALCLAAAEARAQCGASHASCPQAAATGTELCKPDLAPVLEQAARNELGSGGPTYRQIHSGCNNPNPPVSVTATLPCTLAKAVAQTESSWSQFCASSCGGSGLTLISFDCGYGIMQITSGMGGGAGFDPARVAAEPGYNAGTGAKIMMDKWAATPCVGDNRPDIAEDWYMAVWAYNSFGWVNNPNNPNFPAGRAPYRGPGGLSRGSYPYQEIVWGYMNHPPLDSGAERYPALPVSLPDPAGICNTSGCRVANIPDPGSIHCDECQRGNTAALPSPPATLRLAAGASGSVQVDLRNDGLATWDTGYALVRVGGEALGPDRVALPAAVAPGATAHVSVPVQAGAAGAHSATYQLQQDPCAFGPTVTVSLDVVAGGSTGTSSSGSSGSASSSGASSSSGSTGSTGSTTGSTGGGDAGACVATGPEVCNGLDDDCSGQVDDGAPCPPGLVCRDGACLVPSTLARGACGCGAADGAALAPLLLLGLARRRRPGGRAGAGPGRALPLDRAREDGWTGGGTCSATTRASRR